MSPLRTLLFVALAALPAAPNGCHAPRARISVTRLEGTRPELLLLHCLPSGFPTRPHFTWHLPAAARLAGVGQPVDEDALLVQLNESSKLAEQVECVVNGDGGAPVATATWALGPSLVGAAKEAAGVLTVDGSGFPAHSGEDDAVWLVPARGAAVRADSACKAASWSEMRVVACLPKLAKKSYQVRVQSGGRLALGPALVLGTP